MRSKNSFWYNSWRKGNKPRRRAVASHSKFAWPNPDGFSRYIPNEERMHHTERKETILPCGYTIAESWAALRKSWLGFKIARCNFDAVRATEYASIITKLQVEMGIPITHFDSDILDEEAAANIKPQRADTDQSQDGSLEIAIEDEDEEDGLPNYERIMNNPSTTAIRTEPREEIFARYHGREKSCPWVRQAEDEEGNEEESDFELAMHSKNPRQEEGYYSYITDEDTTSEVTEQEEQTRKSCYYRRGKQTRNSCHYKRKGN